MQTLNILMSWEKLSFTVENKMGNLYKLEIVILNLTLTRHFKI